MKLQEGTLLKYGSYRIESILGQGGFGITYLAVQVGLNRQVAIKEFFMKEYCNRDETTSQVSVPSAGSKDLVNRFKAKFIKEAQTIAKLNHPNIIRIYDIFEENGTAYYVMEYHGKGSLSELLKSKGKLPESEALRYIRQVADALSYIHENKMNHLDVKPGNVLLDSKGNAVLIDFGMSKRYDEAGNQTSTTPVGISHGYAPMEQYKKGGVSAFSPATDIYSLGATLYKLITGETPPEAVMVVTEGIPSVSGEVSKEISRAIEASLQPNITRRPQSIAEFLQLLEEEAETESETKTEAEESAESEATTFTVQEKETAKSFQKANNPEIPENKKTAELQKTAESSNVTESQKKEAPTVPAKPKKRGWLYGAIACVIAAVLTIFVVSVIQKRTEADERAQNDSLEYSTMIASADSLSQKGDKMSLEKSKEKYVAASKYEEEYGKGRYSDMFSKNASKSATELQNRIDSLVAAEEAAAKKAEEERLAKQRAEEERKAREAARYKATGSVNGHGYVDLGLSVKWATCNVGATSPEGYGNYYAWGETSPKSNYTWETYKFRTSGDSEDNVKFNKYNSKSDRGTIDNKTTLDLSDDAARVNLGGSWRMPTRAEIVELRDNCTWTYTKKNGIKGYKVTSKTNGNSIFLPVTGYYDEGTTSVIDALSGFYWSSSLYESYPYQACEISFYSGDVDWSTHPRNYGQTVRAVCP